MNLAVSNKAITFQQNGANVAAYSELQGTLVPTSSGLPLVLEGTLQGKNSDGQARTMHVKFQLGECDSCTCPGTLILRKRG